ncbi:MAG: LptF/LptG family permease [Planctomycetes bacterium]|nr:LptF/LptG family permease [Planctomycetota bacterium]
MLRVQRVVLVELVTTLLLTLLVVTAVLFAGLCLQTMSRFDVVDLSFLLTLLPPLLPVAIAFSLPFAYLLAVALVYGRLVSDRELVALRISGVHPRAVASPALSLGAVLGLVSLALTGWVLPEGSLAGQLQESNLADQFLGQLASSRRSVTTSRCRFSFGRYEPAGRPGTAGVFRDFEMDLRASDAGGTAKILGDELRLLRQEDGALVLKSPRAYFLQAGGTRGPQVSVSRAMLEVGHVEDLGASAAFNDLLGVDRVEVKARQVALPDVFYLVQRGELSRVPLRRSLTELHGRLATAVLPLLFALVSVGVCFQLSPRARRLTGFLLAFLPILVVHIPLWVAGKSLSDAGRVPAWAGMWLPDAGLLAVGIVLFGRAYRR